MTKLLIISSILLGTAIRVIPAYAVTFTTVGIKFPNPDSYYYAYWIQQAVVGGDSPGGIFSVYIHASSLLIRVSHIDAETVLTIIPLIIFAMTVPAVYFTAKLLFNRNVAIASCFAFAVIPGEYVCRTMLGWCDHHALEVLIISWAGFGLLSIFRFKTWSAKLIIFCLILPLVIVYLQSHWPQITSYYAFLASGYAHLTSEARSIWMMPLSWYNIGNILVAVSLIIFMLFKKRSAAVYAFITWSLLVVFMSVMQKRFDYYLAFNLAILCGYGISWGLQKARDVLGVWGYWCFVVVFIIVMAGTAQASYLQVKGAGMRPSDEWVNNLKWLSQQEPGKVVAPWSYGYWLQYYGLEPLVTPGQNISAVQEVSKFFISENATPPDAKYIIIDSATVLIYIPSMAEWAGENPNDYATFGWDGPNYTDKYYKTIAVRLFYDGVEGYTYLKGENVKIYKVGE